MTASTRDVRALPVPASWAGLVDSWVDHLAASGATPGTCYTRRVAIERLARWVGDDVPPGMVTGDQLVEWSARHPAWSRETRRSAHSSLRSFFGWLGSDAATVLPRVSPAPPRPRPLPDPAYRATVDRAGGVLRVVVRLAGECGLRRCEIARVHALDVWRADDGWWLSVRGKGGRGRDVPMPGDLAAAVLLAAGGGWLLPGRVDGHVSPGWLGRLAAGVLPPGWGLHTLRHRYATTVYRATGDLLAVQQLLGHASPATTQRYVAVGRDRLRRAAAAA